MIDKIKNTFSSFKSAFPKESDDELKEDFVELTAKTSDLGGAKLVVKYFTLSDFAEVREILDSLRDGYTIAFIKIRPLKERNLNELRRAIDKIKKTCFALEGEVVGLEEDWIVAVPPYVKVHRGSLNEETSF
ncbi:MAG: cell division protein SepF [Nanoarchaeota archaeon]|nr:cell division protein SepF [Nanoarchaeota archaeon]